MQQSLNGVNKVAALGKKAQLAHKVSGFSGPTLKESHPSLQAMNRSIPATGSTRQERSQERIEKFAKALLDSKDT